MVLGIVLGVVALVNVSSPKTPTPQTIVGKWVNSKGGEITFTADGSGTIPAGPDIPAATFTYTFNSAGTFAYHCSIHPSMKGTVIVQ